MATKAFGGVLIVADRPLVQKYKNTLADEALLRAAQKGSIPAIKFAIANGADIMNAEDKFGRSAPVIAFQSNRTEALLELAKLEKRRINGFNFLFELGMLLGEKMPSLRTEPTQDQNKVATSDLNSQ